MTDYKAMQKAAYEGNFALVKSIYATTPDILMANMAVIGIGDFLEETKHQKQNQNQKTKTTESKAEHKEIFKWAVTKGGCEIFSFTSDEVRERQKGDSFFTRMKGNRAGDVTKGTFGKK